MSGGARDVASAILGAEVASDAPGIVAAKGTALAVLASALAPDLVAAFMAAANARVLPAPTDGAGTEAHSGWQSLSALAPSTLTRMTERAARDNNELPAT